MYLLQVLPGEVHSSSLWVNIKDESFEDAELFQKLETTFCTSGGTGNDDLVV